MRNIIFRLAIVVLIATLLVGGQTGQKAFAQDLIKFSAVGPQGDLTQITVNPLKVAGVNNEQTCTLPAGCNVLGDFGVLGTDIYEEAQANDSAIWTGSADHYILENSTGSVLLPGWGYATMFATSFHIEGGGYEFNFPSCGESCAWGVVVRGDADGEHILLELSNYGAPGAAIVTRYPVSEQAGGFFSQNYFVAQAANALQFDNCRADGCDKFFGAMIDLNDGSLSVISTDDAESWVADFTNVEPAN